MERLFFSAPGTPASQSDTTPVSFCGIPERVSDPYFLVDAGGGNGISAAAEKGGCRSQDRSDPLCDPPALTTSSGCSGSCAPSVRPSKRKTIPERSRFMQTMRRRGLGRDMSRRLLRRMISPAFSGHVSFEAVGDGEKRKILGREVTFFDIRSTKAKQSGFCMRMENGKKLTYCGDEPCQKDTEPHAEGADLSLIHEAFASMRTGRSLIPTKSITRR